MLMPFARPEPSPPTPIVLPDAMRFVFLMFAVLLAAPAQAQALALTPTAAEGYVHVETNAPNALVLVDGELLGAVSTGPFLVREGVVAIEVRGADAEQWQPRTAAATIEVLAGDTSTVRLDLPLRYRIETLPAGALIALETPVGEEVLGETPLVVDRQAPLAGTLVARAPGFLDARAVPGDSLDNRLTLLLRPLEVASEATHAADWRPPREPRRWLDYAAAGVALAAAGVAVYYKFEADAIDDRYRAEGSPERGDPLLKAEAERLDGYSLAALGVMQAGVTFLAVRFILR